ncbi:ras association domain-containing protein 10-like [Periplaneta americana]|uniref:ras association domain-containing protein 10-like n=1 Tax=Periplaneta americana TaxID=6978 RepID=UPI0037E9BC4C
MTAEIPVWVNSRLRWVTGIGRKTTCDDVIAVLLRGEEEGRGTTLQDGQGYAIMERWRRMERPLDGRSRILRVWNAWGDAQNEVRFTLKKVTDWEADSGRGSPSTSLTRRRKHHRGSKLPWPPHHQTLHPRRLAQLHHHHHHNQKDLNNKLPETIERLMKLILAQGETIQNQLRRLHDRDHQIEHLEGETHRARVETLGSNYLLETYLKSCAEDADEEDADEEEKGDDSGVVTEGGSDQTPPPPPEDPPSAAPSSKRKEKDKSRQKEEPVENDPEAESQDEAKLAELKERVELWEKLVKVNKRLEREEESLVRLHIKFRRYRSQQAEGLRLLPEEEMDKDSHHAKDALLRDLEHVRLELEKGTRELEHNALALAETEALLEARRHYLRRLQAELEASDRETDRLNHEMVMTAQQASEPAETQQRSEASATAACSSANDTDSNSDTGLSSLHSSSEEGVYVLDTLV